MAVFALRSTLLVGATMLAACGAASSSVQQNRTTATTASPSRGDSFRGKITAATGRLAGERGDVRVVLAHAPRGKGSTSVTLSIIAAGCGGQPRCLRLNGRLSGRMTPERSLPDVGHRFEIGARGAITPLGQVEASGTANGTGFIRSGHTGLNLTLHGASGTVTIEGQSGPVPSFSEP